VKKADEQAKTGEEKALMLYCGESTIG